MKDSVFDGHVFGDHDWEACSWQLHQMQLKFDVVPYAAIILQLVDVFSNH